MKENVENLIKQLPDIEEALGKPDVFDDQDRYKELAQKHAYLQSLKTAWEELSSLQSQLQDNKGTCP